jgi:hypothetical protein
MSDWDREQLKYELAKKFGINKYIGDDWGDISSKNCGSVGRKMRSIIKR